MTDKKAEVLITRAAANIRKAAVADRKRRAELTSVAEYLESMIYETELGYDKPLFEENPVAASGEPLDDIKRMMKPFKVRLTR
ncbi:MAG: hypothetical protein SFV21_09060 [Rhodospirillaceae bacterium]|nr:hypothetical protein [Rhodospirillaceae bacterium]